MSALQFTRRSILTLLVSAAVATTAFGQTQTQTKPFEPQVGQPGKDVVWVPTSQALVDKMLDLAKVTAQDTVYDLGSGDGRTVITAAKRGARAFGIEYNPDMVELSKKNASEAGVSEDRATFMKADLFETDFSKATVITMFLLPDINLRLRPKILDMRPGTRIVSNTFTMGDWEADVTETVTEGCTTWCTALHWIVPGQGRGHVEDGAGRRAGADADLPEGVRHAAERREHRPDHRRQAARRRDHVQGRHDDVHGPRQRQHDQGHLAERLVGHKVVSGFSRTVRT